MQFAELKRKTSRELRDLAGRFGSAPCPELKHHELIAVVLKGLIRADEEIAAEGMLEILGEGFGFLRAQADDFQPGPSDIYVSPSQIRRFELRTGDTVRGVIRGPKDGERYLALLRVDRVNGADPESRTLTSFEELPITRPSEVLELGTTDPQLAALAALAPIGLGQRCAVSGPSGPVSRLLGRLIASLGDRSELDCVGAVLGARPECVAELDRKGPECLVTATFDQPAPRVLQLAELALARAKRRVEMGRDVVLVIDSLSAIEQAALALSSSSCRWAGQALVRAILASAHGCGDRGSITVIAALGSSAEIAELGRCAANSRWCLGDDAERDLGIDWRGSATEEPEGLLDAEALECLRRARSAIAARGGLPASAALLGPVAPSRARSALAE